jgi:hypothetical protein
LLTRCAAGFQRGDTGGLDCTNSPFRYPDTPLPPPSISSRRVLQYSLATGDSGTICWIAEPQRFLECSGTAPAATVPASLAAVRALDVKATDDTTCVLLEATRSVRCFGLFTAAPVFTVPVVRLEGSHLGVCAVLANNGASARGTVCFHEKFLGNRLFGGVGRAPRCHGRAHVAIDVATGVDAPWCGVEAAFTKPCASLTYALSRPELA